MASSFGHNDLSHPESGNSHSQQPPPPPPQQQQMHLQHHQHQQEMIDMQSSRNKRLSATSSNKMMVTIDGEEEELEVIGSGISGTFQPPSERRPRLPMKLPNLKYDTPESSVHNYSPGTSVVFNAFRGHGRLLTQPYAASSDNNPPMEHTYKHIPDSQSQEWSQDPYSHHRHPQPLPPSHSYDSDGHSPYHQQQQRYSDYPSYRSPHDRQYPPYIANGHDPRDASDPWDPRDPRDPIDPRDYRDSREYRNPRHAREAYGREFDSPHSQPGPPSPRIGSALAGDLSAKLEDQESRGRMAHYPVPHTRDGRVSQAPPPPASHRLRSPHSALDPLRSKNADLPYDEHANIRYHSFPSQLRSPAEPWDSSSEHRPPYPSAAIDIPQPPHRRSVNTPNDYRRHEPMDNSRQHHTPYSHLPQQSPSSSAAGPSNYRDPFNPPRGEGPRYEFTRINYRMIFEYASEIRDCLIKGKVGTTDRLLYNAEILSKVFMGCRVDQEPVDHVDEELALNPHQLRCTSCNIVKTPEWRKGPLGPRTLCNACGLIWGKLSRSKAALAKSKQEANTKAEPEKSGTDAPPSTGDETPKRPAADTITLTDIARKKRGRGRSATRDADDMGAVTRTNETDLIGLAAQDHGSSSQMPHSKQSSIHSDSSNHGQPGQQQSSQQQQMEDVTMSGGDSPPLPPSSFQTSTATKEPGTVQEAGCQIDPLSTAVGPVPSPQSPDSLPFSAHENHDKEGPASGRKFTLSYLLA